MYSQFSGTANWSLYPLKILLFLESSVRNILIPTANLLIIPGPQFCRDCLSPMMVSIISSWRWRFPSSETLSSTVVLFLLWCDDDPRLSSKSSEIFCCQSLPPFNSVTTWQDDGSNFSWLSKSPTCSGSNSRGSWRIWPCSKWKEFGMVSAAGGTAGFEGRLGSWKYCKLGTGTCLHLRQGILHLCHSWYHFVESFLQSWYCRQRFRGYLCDFSLLLIYCYFSNWDCVHNRGSCILNRNMLRNRSQEVSTRLFLSVRGIDTDVIGGNFKLFLWYLFVLQNSYQSKYVKNLCNLNYINSLVKIR